MLPVLITIDTEYSSGLFKSGAGRSCDDNFARCVECVTGSGPVGIGYQMDVFERRRLKATFFVDPMPSLVWGTDAIRRVVQPIIDRGFDVQLHLHTEWLDLADGNPLSSRTGQNIADFPFEDQKRLISFAAETLMAAGAPAPVAFRAGNYGANDDTLRALAELGIGMETSFPPGLDQSACEISLTRDVLAPLAHHGVTEIPIGAIGGKGAARRHAQITAMSLWEMTSAIRHARDENWPALVLVSHSFEMMNRRRGIANRIVKYRFERLCEWLAAEPGVTTTDFTDRQFTDRITGAALPGGQTLLPHNPLRTYLRMGEQALANALYG